ncbi:MAG: polyprenol monophosphomannose synthase [Candidatus Omnitrophota bacterium]
MITIVLPTYNEAENTPRLIMSLENSFKDSLEILVVDDDSPDKTWQIVESMGLPEVRVIRRIGERGLATAIARGVDEARGDIVGWMDVDMCHPPSLLPQMLSFLNEYDVVIGSRYVNGGKDDRGPFRVFTSRLINRFAGLLLGFYVKDYDSGFILIKKEVIDRVGFPSSGYGDYFIELMYRCKRNGFKVKEVPYVFRDREVGESKTAGSLMDFFKLGFGYITRIVKLRFRS